MSVMSSIKKDLDELKQLRDELRVQMTLAKAEARDAVTRLEARWPEVERRVRDLADATDDSATEVAKATRTLIDELKRGYRAVLHDSHDKRS